MDTQQNLEIHQTPSAEVRVDAERGCWHLEIPPGSRGCYRLAQLDDYTTLSRQSFPYYPPLTLSLRARLSGVAIPGTWGFGLWNDPFSLSLSLGGGTRRFPALPNATWFFYASPQNYLSFRDDLPANGFIAQTFQSPHFPTPLMALGAPALALLLWPWMARKLRPIFRRWIKEDSFAIEKFSEVSETSEAFDITQWHSYTLQWYENRVSFQMDGLTFETRISPIAPLGLVIWIDNQYAAFPPNGKLTYGTLANSHPTWLEIEALSLQKG